MDTVAVYGTVVELASRACLELTGGVPFWPWDLSREAGQEQGSLLAAFPNDGDKE